MAASGIAEHNEARRRELVYLRKAFQQREMSAHKSQSLDSANNPPNGTVAPSYRNEVEHMERMGRLGPGSGAQAVDRQKRLAHYKQAAQDYSAKLPNRYTSIDYVSQW